MRDTKTGYYNLWYNDAGNGWWTILSGIDEKVRIGIDAEDSVIIAPKAKIRNQNIGIKARKSIVDTPELEVDKDGKED